MTTNRSANRRAPTRRELLRVAALAGCSVVFPLGAAWSVADEKKPGAAGRNGGAKDADKDVSGSPAFESKRRAAVTRAFAYLDGRIHRLPDSEGTPTKPFTIATTGLAKLVDARTVTGDDSLARCRDATLKWLVKAERESSNRDRLASAPGNFSSSEFIQYVWPVAMGGLFLAESVARDVAKEESTAGLKRALRILAAAQAKDGGWGHHAFKTGPDVAPVPRTIGGVTFANGGYPATFVAPSNCAAPVLGLARALVGQDATAGVERARSYYRAARLTDGSFPYDASQRSAMGSVTNVGRTAGAIFAERCLGSERDADHRRSVSYWTEHMEDTEEGHGSPCLNTLHGALAGLALGTEPFAKYRNRVHPLIVAKQREDGSLACLCRKSGFGVTCDDERLSTIEIFAEQNRAYATSLLLLTLVLDTGRMKLLDKLPTEGAGAPATTPGGPPTKR